MFLDDGLCGSPLLDRATIDSKEVKGDLLRLGFLLSEEKCFWEPTQKQTCLGHVFDMSQNLLYVAETRVARLEQTLAYTTACSNKVTARQLAAAAGQIVSMSRAIGSTVYFYTRHIYYAIETRNHWDSILPITSDIMAELQYWKTNVRSLNGKNMFSEPQHFDTFVYSDASDQGYGGYAISNQQRLVCQGHWSENERAKSSTWRELKAVNNMLLAIGQQLHGHKLQWYTDNQNIVRIVARGSRKPDLQGQVVEVIQLSKTFNILVCPVWVPREQNQIADYLSKISDGNDWSAHPNIFQWLDTMWGPFTFDRFATSYSTKCLRFNSCFWNPHCEGVDSYAINWAGENNSVVPPPNQIIRAWKHYQICRARGVMVVPLWRGSPFWPSLCPDGIHLAKCITDWVGIPEWIHPATLPGRSHNTLFTGEKLPFRLIAMYINW
ncbi:uncharacterized protein [Montipora capricornis]|uniref:uncharacterized protein n=1 Tax=Montipora capricornis TaxID=246305 RepID=UPI0035F212B7